MEFSRRYDLSWLTIRSLFLKEVLRLEFNTNSAPDSLRRSFRWLVKCFLLIEES